ncbi:hypothetical protein NPA31_005515 [Aurantimonas sp. MSK8Z-1]|uniref:hypothetical protein n=1 Tax=Mangrovibrevibacter kandeliae TaxID=2968473 RepID=UPI002118839C|nr:hypothetical protein [Aurantimonas sp. MSK8Z-1]MCW4114420.1 hypothetical protein [Aurantimonas sp. MSK8Z-1]
MSSRYGEMLRALFASSEEQFAATVYAAGRAEYARLGVTDAVLLRMAETGAYLLTADLELYLAALAGGLPAENFAHLQALRADYQ